MSAVRFPCIRSIAAPIRIMSFPPLTEKQTPCGVCHKEGRTFRMNRQAAAAAIETWHMHICMHQRRIPIITFSFMAATPFFRITDNLAHRRRYVKRILTGLCILAVFHFPLARLTKASVTSARAVSQSTPRSRARLTQSNSSPPSSFPASLSPAFRRSNAFPMRS